MNFHEGEICGAGDVGPGRAAQFGVDTVENELIWDFARVSVYLKVYTLATASKNSPRLDSDAWGRNRVEAAFHFMFFTVLTKLERILI